LKEDGEAWAIAVSWKKGVDGLPDTRAWNEAIESNPAECGKNGATVIDSRVVTASEGVDGALAAARAAMHRDFLAARGFTQGEGRVEYRMDLEEALAALEAGKIASKLAWNRVDADNEPELARAAGFFRQASEGDPASHPDEDTLGFLKVLLEDEETAKAPERVQIGMCEGVPAAVLALMSYPSDGWSTIYYLGVLPAFRGRGFGAEAMLHAFCCLKAMGGKTYQDGTGSNNAAARSLFARLGRPLFRVMEEWRLEK
jgi:GNAT superfamily N-acetyltransferase